MTYSKRQPPVRCICQAPDCGKEFFLIAARVRQGKGKFCSPSCRDAWRSQPERPREFFVAMSQQAKQSENYQPMRNDEADFWALVEKRGSDECWPFRGQLDKDGYGQFQLKTRRRAHRLVWEFVNGPIPAGMFACHHCDNPQCCNPAHLFVGTAADNAHDRDAKGRIARGENGKWRSAA